MTQKHTQALSQLRDQLTQQGDRSAKNLLSLANVILHEQILSEAALVGLLENPTPEALSKAQNAVSAFAKRYGYAPSSVSAYRSRTKQLVDYYQQHLASQPPSRDTPVGQQLMWFARRANPGATQQALLNELHNVSGISEATLKRWDNKGSKPRQQHYPAIEKLAVHFGLESGYFTAALSDYFAMRAVEQAKTQSRAPREPLPPAPEWPEELQQQLAALHLFKNKARAPSINLSSFKLRRREAPALTGGGRWTSTPDGNVESANNFTRALERYFRWALANHPLKVEQLDLSLLCTIELLEEYVDDVLEAELYATLLALLAPLAGMVEPDTGYLARYHAPVKELELREGVVTESFADLRDWQDQARYLNHQIKAWVKDARHLHRQLNHDTEDNGRRNINWLLDRPDATLADSVADLRLMVDDLTAATAHQPLSTQLNALQVGTWLALSLEVPLRVSNWCAIELLAAKPAAGHTAPALWWDEALQAYRIRVPRGWLKNRRGRETEQIDTTFAHPQAKDALDSLLALRAKAGIASDHLFIQTRASAKRRVGEALHRAAFAKAIQSWTGRIAFARWAERGITNGINPHALRHFVASYVLEKTGDFRLAATSLMDSVSVVISVYGKNDHATNQRRLAAMQDSADDTAAF